MCPIMPFDQVVKPRLASELVHSLCDFVTGSIAKSWKERGKFADKRRVRGVAKEYGIQCG
jgi:hypothetical protein